MTENECIETLQYLLGYENAVDKGELEAPNNLNSQEKEALQMIIEEIQQYRAIGTVKEIKIREAQFARLSEGYLNDLTLLREYQAIGTVEELQKSVKEEDILKFYYIKSEDKYVVGQRVDTMYYAEVGKTGLCFYMSRYLPWGEHVVAPDTLWKEHTYPSEPEEIPFFDWLQGFMKKNMVALLKNLRH